LPIDDFLTFNSDSMLQDLSKASCHHKAWLSHRTSPERISQWRHEFLLRDAWEAAHCENLQFLDVDGRINCFRSISKQRRLFHGEPHGAHHDHDCYCWKHLHMRTVIVRCPFPFAIFVHSSIVLPINQSQDHENILAFPRNQSTILQEEVTRPQPNSRYVLLVLELQEELLGTRDNVKI
jgi:hypothetical protein